MHPLFEKASGLTDVLVRLEWTEAIPPYAIGGCAAFWTIQRVLFFYGF
jgi:hypothetical protein